MSMDEIIYPGNYLSEVIVRIDFLNSLKGISETLPPAPQSVAKKRFPVAEPTKSMLQEVQVAVGQSVETKQTEVTQWNFHSKDRKNTLSILPNAVFLRLTHYTSYDDLRNDFRAVVDAVFSLQSDLQATRLGLRYINRLEMNEEDPLDWADYVSNDLLCHIRALRDVAPLSKVMCSTEFTHDDATIRFQFGMPNPDYPAAIRRKIFILDVDAYYKGILDRDEVYPSLDSFHERIQALFELSITDGLRTRMRSKRG